MTACAESYPELHLRGDVADSAVLDSLRVTDDMGRPYRVVSADFDGEITTVVLAYTCPENVTTHHTTMQSVTA